jgi:hypothetical protein
MKRRRFLQAAVAMPASSAGGFRVAAARAGDVQQPRQLRFVLTFSNPLGRELAAQQFWCYLPAERIRSQRLQGLQVSVPYQLQTDDLGHRVLALSFDRFPAYGRKIVTVTAGLELGPDPMTGSLAETRKLEGRDEWLRPECYIESDAPEIRGLAAHLHQATDMASTRAIYEWVQKHVAYAGYLADDFGALYALRSGSGDCTEYADLVVALARANGIPARMVGGYVADRDFSPRPQDYHNWAEVFLSDAWRVVDAQKKNWLPSTTTYIAFRIYRDVATNAVGSAHRYRILGDLQVSL